MAHDYYLRKTGTVDIQHWIIGSHSGPECKNCGLRFCFNCNPELLNTTCADFQRTP